MAYEETDRLPVPKVYCEVTGAGRPVVFTHDGLLHGECWDAQVGAFAAGHRVARWDRRGYGRSARPTGPFSSVEDLAAVVRAVSDAPAILVGCSFGGFFSLQCALDHPELVAALVLVGPVVNGMPFSEHFLTRGGGLPAPGTTDAELIAYWSERDRWYTAPASTAARERLRELLTAYPHNLHPPFELELPPPVPAVRRLGEIQVPVLVLAGEQDIPDVHAHSGAVVAGVTGAQWRVVPGSGHLPYLEVPEAFNRTVLEFFADLPVR